MISKEVIDNVKKENPGKKLFQATINYQAGIDGWKTEEFLYRQPTVADAEMLQAFAVKNPFEAQNNFLLTVVVHPAPIEVVDRLRNYPMAVSKFMDDCINPFFGGTPTITNQAV